MDIMLVYGKVVLLIEDNTVSSLWKHPLTHMVNTTDNQLKTYGFLLSHLDALCIARTVIYFESTKDPYLRLKDGKY